MSAVREPSLVELQHNSERSRAELAMTVGRLRVQATHTASEFKERISVPHLKQEVKGHIRESGDNFVREMKAKAIENPLQAAAVGVALAYPLWSLLRRIPVPLMLVGAGFWLSGQDRRHSSVEAELTKSATDQATDVGGRIQAAASDGASRLAGALSDATDAARANATAAIGTVSNLIDDAGKVVSSFATGLSDAASEASSAGTKEIIDMTRRASASTRTSTNALLDFVQRNPLIVAGSGLALGAFIAASIPRSDVEDRLVGPGSDFIKNKARQAASDGADHAAKFAVDMVGDIVASAAQQGLSGDGIGKAVDRLAAGIKSVATRGVQTALGVDEPRRPQDLVPPPPIRS